MPDILSSTLAFTYSNIVLIICQQILKNKHRANTSIKAITMENKDILLYNNILIVTLNRDKNMNRFADYVVSETTTIVDTMKAINRGEKAVAFVCRDGRLIAAVSDGDIRRHIMYGGDINNEISIIANYQPIFLSVDEVLDYDQFMIDKSIQALPIVDEDMHIVDIRFLGKSVVTHADNIGIPVVMMAGGKGSRLKPYTEVLPKPLIPIGEKTITEHIIDRFSEYGCSHFNIIINYKKNFIKSYFQDNEKKYDITFLEEPEFWGTGGGLKLAEDLIDGTFFITNCDVLIDADYKQIFDLHKQQGNVITLVCAKKKIVVPYGTVNTNDDGSVISMTEKPTLEYITNTGVYIAEPEFLKRIPSNTMIHITDVIDGCIADGMKVGTYIIKEDEWLDMGQLDEMERMKRHLNIN